MALRSSLGATDHATDSTFGLEPVLEEYQAIVCRVLCFDFVISVALKFVASIFLLKVAIITLFRVLRVAAVVVDRV